MHVCGLKGVMGSGAWQGRGGTHTTPLTSPQGSGQSAWPEFSGEDLRLGNGGTWKPQRHEEGGGRGAKPVAHPAILINQLCGNSKRGVSKTLEALSCCRSEGSHAASCDVLHFSVAADLRVRSMSREARAKCAEG